MGHQRHQQYYVDQHGQTTKVISLANKQIKELIEKLKIAESFIPEHQWHMYQWLIRGD